MTRREWRIALPLLVGLLACVLAFLQGVRIDNSFDGIAAMRAVPSSAQPRVAVVANHALHVLDATGKRLWRQPLAEIGLVESPNDMDWTVDAKGRVEAWFFEDTQPRVVRCGWDEQQGALRGCTTALSGSQLKWSSRSRAVHLAVDRAGERVFLADAHGHHLQVFDLAGKLVARSDGGALPLYFPNRLRVLAGERLAIADNDHHRVVWADVTRGRAPRLVGTLSSFEHPQSRADRLKVTDVAFGASGAIWMLAVKQGQKDGDILVFDGQRRPVARAALPANADPLVLEALADEALAADYSLVMLHRIDAQGRYLGEFGDAAFRSELVPMRSLSMQSRWWITGSLAAAVALIVLGLLLGMRDALSQKARQGTG